MGVHLTHFIGKINASPGFHAAAKKHFSFAGLLTRGMHLRRGKRKSLVAIFPVPKTSIFAPLLKPLVFKPKFLTIEKIGLKDVKVIEVGVENDGRLEVPKRFDEVGWYMNGPRAGEDGNAILAGHFDTYTGAPAIFYNLTKLEIGDKVEIKDEYDKAHSFEVAEISYVDVNDPNAVIKAYEQTPEPILTLITCGGVWNTSTHDYSKRLLIKSRASS